MKKVNLYLQLLRLFNDRKMFERNKKKIFIVFSGLVFIEILVRILYPYVGSETGALNLIPSLLFAWFWGPAAGLIGTLITTILTFANLALLGANIQDALKNIIGIVLPFFLSAGFGYFSNTLKKNKSLSSDLELQSRDLIAALEEKTITEKTLLQKIEFIRFSNKISSDFINIPPLLIESRIESAVKHIFDFVGADSCCIYVQYEGDPDYVLYKEFFKSNNSESEHHIYKIGPEKISDLYETLTTQPHLEINKRIWNHPILEVFTAQSSILLPMLSNDKLLGIISFESFTNDNDWSKYFEEVFPLTQQVIAYALERKFAEEKIDAQYEELKSYSESLFIANLKLNNLNETLLKTSNDLKESETRFRELAENLEDIIWLQSGREVLYVNPAYERIWGKRREDLYKRTFDFLDRIHPEDKNEVLKAFSIHDFQNQGVFQKEFRIIDDYGTTKWMLARSFLINNDNGKLKIAGIAEDITPRKKVEEELKNALDKSIELNLLKSRFISTVSHELRTPLATILSSIELLQLYEPGMGQLEREKHFQKVIASIDYLTSLLDDVITIDKTESGIVTVNYEKIDLIDLVNNIIRNIGLIKGTKAHIKLNTLLDTLEITTDKKLLTQIISNLITNAVKFSPSRAKIEVKIASVKDYFIIQVTDRGMGIPADAQNSIFVPFFRAPNAQNIQGTGLGLSIAKRWCDLLKGNITFESKPQKGTTFTVKMPVDSESHSSKQDSSTHTKVLNNFLTLF